MRDTELRALPGNIYRVDGAHLYADILTLNDNIADVWAETPCEQFPKIVIAQSSVVAIAASAIMARAARADRSSSVWYVATGR
jgi:hypothetical protein